MREQDPGEVTRLLQSSQTDNYERLLPLVYDELRRTANALFRRERAGHTLQPTALVHEAYLRLINQNGEIQWQSREHFFGIAARLMRQILVNHAVARRADKRGGGCRTFVAFDETGEPRGAPALDILELHDALNRLAALDERQARIVELRFFGGLTLEETAAFLQLPVMRVRREWNSAKLWLYRTLDN